MDLRSYIKTPDDLAEAKAVIASGSFIYQPFRIADDLEVGAGYEFSQRTPGTGLVYWPTYATERAGDPPAALAGRLVDPRLKDPFTAANAGLRAAYDGYINQIVEHLGGVAGYSIGDIGCFNGYVPVSFALRGARFSVGHDQDDRGDCFRFLNRILGTNARFVQSPYDLASGTMPGCPHYDVVVSMSVLQHMTEPLRHLHFLRSITRHALFIVTNVWDDDDYVIRMGEANQVFPYAFPWCFDNSIYMSEKLLRRALAKAGFSRLVELEARNAGNVPYKSRAGDDYGHNATRRAHELKSLALLAFVEGSAAGAAASLRQGYAPPPPGPELLEQGPVYNIVRYAGRFYAAPIRLGVLDLTSETDRSTPGILSARTLEKLRLLCATAMRRTTASSPPDTHDAV